MTSNKKLFGLCFLFSLTLAGCGGGGGSGTPSTGTPNTGTPNTGTPNTGTPNTGTPNTGAPNTGAPNTGTPNTGTPNTETPNTETPNTGTPNTGTPNTGTPNTGTPNTGAPNTGAPNTGAPNTGTKTSNIINIDKKDKAHYELAVLNQLAMNRNKCGFGNLSQSNVLSQAAAKRANYIGYVYANSNGEKYNPHNEELIAKFSHVTGQKNKYYTGVDLNSRLKKLPTTEGRFTVAAENISINNIKGYGKLNSSLTSDIYTDMLRQLLAAPYHLAGLVSPNFNEVGVGVSQFVPDNGKGAYELGFAINILSAAKTDITGADKLLTYPCDGITDTANNLRNEAPNPFKDTGRDLQTNPIGQPVYVTYPTAKKIKVSNVKFNHIKIHKDNSIEILEDISVHILDADNDPNKITKPNSAFILPLTDSLDSCKTNAEPGHDKEKGNCGLYINSSYQVSFDVLVDGKTLINKIITFKTK